MPETIAIVALVAVLAAPAGAPACVGDASADGRVTIDELIAGVRISLGQAALGVNPTFDADASGAVEINEVILGVNHALRGCPTALPTATPQPTAPSMQPAGAPCLADGDCVSGACRDDDDRATTDAQVCCAGPCGSSGICAAGSGACVELDDTLVDSAGDVGSYSAIAIGADGRGLVAYVAESAAELRVAHCADAVCSSAAITVLAPIGVPDVEPAGVLDLAIGADGFALISYWQRADEDLRVVDCGNAACSEFATYRLDGESARVGQHNAIAVGGDGRALISYFDDGADALKVARCSDVNCSAAVISTVDSVQPAGLFTSVAFGWDGRGLIGYRGQYADMLVAHCSDADCTAVSRSSIDFGDAEFISIAVPPGPPGQPRGVISYYDYVTDALKVVRCGDTYCTRGGSRVIAAGAGRGTSLGLIGSLPVISYYDHAHGDLGIVRCFDEACALSDTIQRVLSSHDIGRYPSLAVDAHGALLISYYDATAGDLRVRHCPADDCAHPAQPEEGG